MGSGLPNEPSVAYVGKVAGSTGAQITAADTNGQDIAMVSPRSPKKPCQLFRWTAASSATLATTITKIAPVKNSMACNSTEGLTYTREPDDPSVLTRDVFTVSDNRTTLRYWFLPWS